MSRLRIEGLLAAFPKLVSSDEKSSSKQHTFIETQEVRYIYQPMDALYLLLITNMQSNILEDLSSLRMIAKLVPEYCGGHDEETIQQNAFNLLYALDEVVTPMGYKESVTYKQIEDFVKMDSAEEKLSNIIKESKIAAEKQKMKEMAAKFDKQRRDDAKRMGASPSSFGSMLKSGFGSSSHGGGGGYGDNVQAISSESMKYQNSGSGDVEISHHGGSSYTSYKDQQKQKEEKAKATSGPRTGMKLKKGGRNSKTGKKEFADVELFDEARGLNTAQYIKSDDEDKDDFDGSDRTPIEVAISEKLYVSFEHDGGMKKFEIKGDMEVTVNDPSSTQCVIRTNMRPNAKSKMFDKTTWKLHPRMNASEWKKGILCLKDSNKKFRVGRKSKTSILKWRMSTTDDSNVPIQITFWPEDEGNGKVTVSAQYQCNKDLKNVMISFPSPCNEEPEINSCDNGDTQFYRRDKEFQWLLNDLEDGSDGTLEYVVKGVELEELWPISVHFEIEETYSSIEIKAVSDLDNEEQFEFSTKGTCVAEKYILEQE